MPATPPAAATDRRPPRPRQRPALPRQRAFPRQRRRLLPPRPRRRRSRRRSRRLAPPRETALSDDPQPTLQPDTFFATAKASERYSAIVDAGGWPTDLVAVGPGAKGTAVARLRKRLAIEGDLEPGEASGLAWDKGLTAAVKRFQAHVGLRETGTVSGATLKELNVPARERFNELASSANRLAGRQFLLR